MEKLLQDKFIRRCIFGSAILASFLFVFITFLFNLNTTGLNIFASIGTFKLFTYEPIISIALVILLAALLSVCIFAAFILIFKDKLISIPFVLTLAISILSFLFGIFFNLFSAGQYIFLVLSVLVSLFGLVCYYYSCKFEARAKGFVVKSFLTEPKRFVTLILSALSLLSLIFVFFIPAYSFVDPNTLEEGTFSLINGLNGTKQLDQFIALLVGVVLFFAQICYFLSTLKYFNRASEKYAKKSKISAILNFISALAFFILAMVGLYLKRSRGFEGKTVGYIPLIITSALVLLHSFFNASEEAIIDRTKAKTAVINRIIIFVFVALFSGISLAGCFVNILSVKPIIEGIEGDPVSISGMDVLINADKFGIEYIGLGFIVFTILFGAGSLFVLSLASLLSKSKKYPLISFVTVVVSFIFMFGLGIFGKYYEMSSTINQAYIEKVLELHNVDFRIDITYKAESTAIFLLLADIALGVILIIFKPFTRLEFAENSPLINRSGDEEEKSEKKEEPKDVEVASAFGDSIEKVNFDACPSFTEIDGQVSDFESLMSERRMMLFKDASLPSIVSFIVDYARESRLHLSYTREEIATFVAGLGATKLTILQGMSGTGKTSLPKIFSEAIFGNCELIEVESSWKDKHELLGYYNEFSKIFTPKKFTRALYKATLNKDVVTLIVLDEMNLSRIEYYFSDFLSLMENEPEFRNIQLLNVKLSRKEDGKENEYVGLLNGHTIHVPENVWFVGTANRDESTFEISDKVYDRAHTMNFDKRAPKVRNYSVPLGKRYLNYNTFNVLLESAKKSFNFDLEKVPYLAEFEEILRPYNISFGNRIMNQVEDYVKIYCSCFTNSEELINEALEDILLSKVVHKLEFKAIDDKHELSRKFEKIGLYKCAEFINTLNEDF